MNASHGLQTPHVMMSVFPDALSIGTRTMCNEYGTIYAISSDFGDHMTTQLMRLMILLSEHL